MCVQPCEPQIPTLTIPCARRFDSSPDFAKRALEVAAELQKGGAAEKNVLDTYQRVCEGSRRGFDEIYGKLGVHVQERGESQYAHMLEGIIDELLQKGIATVSDGAICVFLEVRIFPTAYAGHSNAFTPLRGLLHH